MSRDDEPRSLRSLFEAAESKRQTLDTSISSTSPAYASLFNETLALYGRCLDRISAVSLFSPNEGLEDVSTPSLPYLLVDFYLGELIQRTPMSSSSSSSLVALPPISSPSSSSPSASLLARERRPILDRSRRAYERFLNLVDNYGLVTGPYDRLLERYRDDESGFAVVKGADAAARRDGKIANFRAEKELKQKLETLKRNPQYLAAGEDGGGGGEVEGGGGDEELVREVHIAQVAFAVHATFQALDGLNRELEMLAMAPPPSPGETETGAGAGAGLRGPARNGNGNDAGDTRLDQPLQSSSGRGGPLLSKQGRPLQPFTLVGSRQDLARGVFRPGHNLPTMSIDEYLEEEKRRGGILEGGGGEPPRAVVDEDDMEAQDRETYKAREWDAFKDDNPRGSGNTLNMG